MKITEILVESQQLDEGPLLNKIGSAVGKAAGTVAKGIGSVAGGIAGAGSALKKGFQAGKKAVSMAGDDSADEPAAQEPTAGGEPAPAAGTAPTQAAPAPGGSAAAPAAKTKPTSTFGKLSAAANGQAPVADPAAGGTQYAQVKANIDKLDKKGKQRILQLLQKEVGTAPAAPAAGALGSMAGQLAKGAAAEPNTMANAPVSKTNKAKPGNPNAAQAADTTATPAPTKAATPGSDAAKDNLYGAGNRPKGAKEKVAALKKQNKKPAAPSQAEIDADRAKIMGVTSDSIIRTKPMMAESFSLFRKR